MTKTELEQFLFDHMPRDLIGRLLGGVFLAHEVSFRHCESEFEAFEAANLVGHYRRAKLEGYLRDAAAMVAGVSATAVKDDQGPWFHTELRSGPVLLSAKTVQTPCALVERAEFRLTRARGNRQLRLWRDPQDMPAADAPLYVLLLHTASEWDTAQEYKQYGHLPGSAFLAFPSADLDCYVHALNLFETFPAVVASRLPQEWNDEATVQYLHRARQINAA